jgi:malate synthase
LFRSLLPEELAKIRTLLGEHFAEGRYEEAAKLFDRITTDDTYVEFLTLPGYDWLTRTLAPAEIAEAVS